MNPLITLSSVFDAKRLIGRKFSDAEVQSDIKHFPFKVIDKGGKPYIKVQYRGEDKEFVSLILYQPISTAILTLFLVT
jgi:molecular chaperone DnaK (HSP70)